MTLGPYRRRAWVFAIAIVLGSTPIRGRQSQDQRPADSTAVENPAQVEREVVDSDVDQDDARARLEWQRRAWGVANPTFRHSALTQGKDHSDKKNARGPKWVSIGPTGADYQQNGAFTGHVRDSGRARTILPHPTNPDIVYFLSSGGGLWRTNNWSSPKTNWTVLTDDLPTTGGGSVAFGSNPNTLYLGLGDFIDQVLVGGAMTKSTNGGVTWSPILELGSAVSVRDVKVDTSTNRDIVLVATDSGLYRSSDDGATYVASDTFTGLSVWSIVRTSAGWLASAQPCIPAFVGIACEQPTTLYLSQDRGATWAPITNGGGAFAQNGRTTLGVAVPGDTVVYAYSSDVLDNAMKDVYRSTDGGQTWIANGVNATKIPTNPVPNSMPNMNICHGQCFYNQMVLVDPNDPTRNTVWIGGDLASARSRDGGSTWTIETWWLYSQVPGLRYAHADFHAGAFKTTGTPTIILGNDGGMNISEDDGATFSSDKNERLVTHLYYTVAGNPQVPSLVIGGTQDNGTRLRTDNGSIFNQVSGGDGMGTAYSQANTNTVFASAQGSALRTNLSNTPPEVFQNWAAATSGLIDVGFGFFTAIVPAPPALDATGRVFYHFSNSRVWRTVNGGLNWTRIASATTGTGITISPGFPTTGTRRFRSSPYNLGVSPTDMNRIAVGAAGGFLDISTNGGASWTDIDLIARVPGYQGFVTNVTWQDDTTLWITSVAQAPGAVRVIKASIANPGDSWAGAAFVPMQTGLPDLPVTRVYIDPRDPTRSTLYAATHVGVYRTVDGGAEWEPFSNGLPTVRVADIYMPPDGSFTRIATYGRGIWELSQIELVNTTLADDAASCDRDGALDNGESGDLTITLANQGPNNVNQIELTVTSSNPNVSFPSGNLVSFPPLQKRGQSTGSIRVALNGAVGVESTDFQISIVAPELELPSALNVTATHRLNYDERPAATAAESVESANHGWTVNGSAVALPNVTSWQRRALSPIRHVWWGPDNNGLQDDTKGLMPDEQNLVSPILHVGTAPLVISFQHRFSFENGGWDGGVIEISRDDGATWTDIGTAAYNGMTNATTSAPIGRNRRAFVNRMAGWPNFTPVTVNVGTDYANQDVRIRFRIGADVSTGAPGWDIDDITIGGLTNTPFTAIVGHQGVCSVENQ